MIKFFRKIRQRLLTENPPAVRTGKFSKYIFYAIGEILLVVIGILIALQVNNWNEERKKMSQVGNYTQSLISDLVKDSIAISENLDNVERETARYQNFQQRLTKPTATIDTVLQIFNNEFRPLAYRMMTFNDNTFSVLTATGDIELFTDSLPDRLFSLSKVHKEASISRSDSFENFRMALSDFSKKFHLTSSMINSGPLYNNLLKGDKEIFIAQFNAIGSSKQNIYRVTVNHLTTIQDQTHQLLKILRKTM